MGQAGSHAAAPALPLRAHTLPHEPPRHAPKVLPSLTESPRLRHTDNGAILLSGGTISGRRPDPPQLYMGAYRSRSAGGGGGGGGRDPLHRSHTNLDLRHHDSSVLSKRFGSEPDLRGEEEQKPRPAHRHFRKKYRAPPPPAAHEHEASSPDSSEGAARAEPQKKLRLFKTRTETKTLGGRKPGPPPPQYRSLEPAEPAGDRRQHCRYPDAQDMLQTSSSLRREDHLLQDPRLDYRKARPAAATAACRAKTDQLGTDASRTPLLNRNFRYSERFRREEEISPLRREKSFDATLMSSDRDSASPRLTHESRMKALGDQIRSRQISPLTSSKPLRKSLPSLLVKHNEDKDEFQTELKKATNRIRHDLVNKINIEHRPTSQDKLNAKPNPTKPLKVNESSLSARKEEARVVKRPLARAGDDRDRDREPRARRMLDRGQASGKESTPEHSPSRRARPGGQKLSQEKPMAPSKQFYFGMAEAAAPPDARAAPPAAQARDVTDFRLIERRLLARRDDDDEFDTFRLRLKEDCKVRNLSSESALSSGSWSSSDGSLGLALRLRPTLPKKTPAVPRFSPAAAWRQLARLDRRLAETHPLAVETTTSPVSPMSPMSPASPASPGASPRSEQSADKSGDSGISGDRHSDPRADSPSRHPQPEPWTPQQDLGESSSEGGASPAPPRQPRALYSARGQPFSLSLPREPDKGAQLAQGFNSLQKLRKSVSGALGAALGSRRFDLEHQPEAEAESNWYLSRSAPTSLSQPLLPAPAARPQRSPPPDDQVPGEPLSWQPAASYLSWGGHVMYLPPPAAAAAAAAPPPRSKSSGSLETAARAARTRSAPSRETCGRPAAGAERQERPAGLARALPARVEPVATRKPSEPRRGKRFTFQSTVRQLERRRLAERLSREADLKEQQRKSELEAMRRVEEEFQRKRAREKANIRQQLRLVSGAAPPRHSKSRDSPDGSCSSPAPPAAAAAAAAAPARDKLCASSEGSGRSKSTTPVRSEEGARRYCDWAPRAHAHPPATARMPAAHAAFYNGAELSAFSGSPRSDNYRLEFARGGSPRTPRAPRRLPAPRSPSTSGSDLSRRQPIQIRESKESEDVIVPTLRSGRPRAAVATH